MTTPTCTPCPLVSGAFGNVPKDAAFYSMQSKKLLAQEASLCTSETCGIGAKVHFAIPIGAEQVIVAGATQLVTVMTQPIETPDAPNTLDGFDSSTGLFTAPASGAYAITWSFRLQTIYDTGIFTGNIFIILRREPVDDPVNQKVWSRSTPLPPPVAITTTETLDELSATLFLQKDDQVGFRVQRNDDTTGTARLNGNPTSGLYTGVEITRLY